MKFNFANGHLLTLSPGERRGTFYCHSFYIWQTHKTKAPGDPATSVVAQGGGGGLATCDPAQSVSTRALWVDWLPVIFMDGSKGTAFPARGSDIPADQFQLVAGKNGAKTPGL